MGRKKTHVVVVVGKEFPPQLLNSLTQFLDHLTAMKYSPKSVKKRRGCIMHVIEFLDRQSIKRWQDVTSQILDAYCIEILDRCYSPHTIYSYLFSVKSLFEFMEERAILFDNPTRGIILPKPKIELGRVLTRDEIHDLLAQPDLTTPCGVRDRSIIEVFYASGVRLAECAGLTIYDIDVDNQTLKVTGKGTKQRIVPMGHHASKYLKIYLRNARKQLIRDHLPPEELWVGHSSARPLNDASLRMAIKRHAASANLTGGVDTHCLRRTCATHMLQGGAHPVAVSQMLGHSSISSLAHYLKTTITDLTNTHKDSKPGA
jgi:site-specific recombinase XerD